MSNQQKLDSVVMVERQTYNALCEERDRLRTQLAAAENTKRLADESLISRLQDAERERDYYERQVKAGVVSYRPTDGETRAAYGRIHALETERDALRTRAERAEAIVEKAKAMAEWFDAPVAPFTIGKERIDALLNAVRALHAATGAR